MDRQMDRMTTCKVLAHACRGLNIRLSNYTSSSYIASLDNCSECITSNLRQLYNKTLEIIKHI